MGYDPIGDLYTGSPDAALDPIAQQQAYEQNAQAEREEQERQALAAQAAEQEAAQQQQADQKLNEEPSGFQLGNIGQNIQNAFEAPTALVGGLIDFADDTVETVGQLTGNDWEFIPDDWGPQNKTPWGKSLRAIVSFIGPTIGVGSLTRAGLMSVAKLGKLGQASKAVDFIGKMGVDMAAGTAVDYINRHSEGDNLVRTLKDAAPDVFSWLPEDWATLDSDSPDIKRKKNVYEGAGLGFLGSIVEAGVIWARALKGMPSGTAFKPIDDQAKKAFSEITNKSPVNKSDHPVLDRILKDEEYRQKHIDEMAMAEVNQAGGIENINDFSPNIHSQIADDYETIPHAVRPDAVPQMMVDNARIADNIGTLDGRPAKFHSDAFLKSVTPDDIASRKLVRELDQRIKDTGNFEAGLPNGRMMNKEELLRAGDNLAAKILDPQMQAKDLNNLFDSFRDSIKVASGVDAAKPITAEGSAAAKSALKELTSFYLNMDSARASAYWQTSLAGEAADSATAARVMGEGVDVTYIQERILDKMEVLWYETDMAGSIHGWALNNEKIWMETAKNNPEALPGMAKEALSSLKDAKRLQAQQKRAFWTELKNMNKTNPEYLAPLMRAYELTDGNVNSIHKLNKHMEQVLGVVNKALVDGQPQIPSQVIQSAFGALYNAKLSSLITPAKAVVNNFALLLLKPMNVALGASLRGDWHTLHRGWMQYATQMDTTVKASADYMTTMFKKVAADPSFTQRADFVSRNDEVMTLAREYAQAEALKGNYGPSMKVNFVDTMNKINDHPWVRYSMNFMESGDAFVKSALSFSEARGRAYDEFFLKHGKAPNAKELDAMAESIRSQMFTKEGLMTDEAVKYASGEISMNLDNELASNLNEILKKAPVLKSIVLFPRTSVNVLDFVHKHSPLSFFVGDLNKMRQLKEVDEIAAYMASKGQKYSEPAWKAMKAEVEGRVAMGTSLVTMGAWAYASGNLSGNGNFDKQVNKFQQNAGDKPLRSIKIGDKWVSYESIEPMATFLALTADVMENANSLGSTSTEKLLNKLGYAVSMNLTNKSFLQGIQPLTELMSGQPHAIDRWLSNLSSVGVLNQMSRLMNPGLREVEDDLLAKTRNKWNILDTAGIGEALPFSYDFIDGSVVGKEDPLTNAWNNLQPFKLSSDPSPVKQFLIDTEFDVQPSMKKSLKGATYDAGQRSRLSQIMGQSGHFRTGLELLMKDKRVKEDIASIRKAREQGVTQEQADLSNSYTHIRIRRLLTQSLNHAKRQLAQEMPDIRLSELTAKKTREAQRKRDYGTVLQLQNK